MNKASGQSAYQDTHQFGLKHDHDQCVHQALENARQVCIESGARLTWIRHRILELIWSSHTPVLAYELLKIIRLEKPNAEPPTVYRALEFLLDQNLIHKIESLNAYAGCPHPNVPHNGLFLICTECREVAEMDIPDINKTLAEETGKSGFRMEQQTMEILGVCPACQQK